MRSAQRGVQNLRCGLAVELIVVTTNGAPARTWAFRAISTWLGGVADLIATSAGEGGLTVLLPREAPRRESDTTKLAVLGSMIATTSPADTPGREARRRHAACAEELCC